MTNSNIIETYEKSKSEQSQSSRIKKWLPLVTECIRVRKGQKRPGEKGWPTHVGTPKYLARIVADGDNIGLLTRRFPAIDIDIPLPALAAIAGDLALEMLGPAPVRSRRGTGKHLLLYRAAEGETLRKRRFVFRTEDGKEYAVELLATGQQFVCDGVHPEGMPYEWDEPFFSPEDLTELRGEQWDAYCHALTERLQRVAGCTTEKIALGGSALSGTRTRDPASLLAPEPETDPIAAMRWWKDRHEDSPIGHNEFVDLCAAFRGAAGDYADELFDDFRECLPPPRDTEPNTEKTFTSFDSGVRLGWSRLCQITGYSPPETFAEPVDQAALNAAIENPPDDFSENQLARRFADLHAEGVRYAAKEGQWLEWNEARWRPDEKLHLMTLARQFCRQVAQGGGY